MTQHHTAFFEKNKRKAEEFGGKSFGLAPFDTFLQEYYHHFHARTRSSFHERASQYLSGIFQLDDRRNVSRIDEKVMDSEYQSLHHFLANSPWDDRAVCAQISRDANNLLGGSPETCLLIDPSGIPKKGTHSVGVARQYCGNLGKVDNCQIGVFSSLARGRDACLINKKLYLPKGWTEDPQRCDKAGVPKDHQLYKKSQDLALELVDDADEQGLDYDWIGMDAEFGKPWLLHELNHRGKTFMVDLACDYRVYQTCPKTTQRPRNQPKGSKLRLRQKAVKVERIRKSHRGRWRRVEIRDSTKGIMVAEYLHKMVWIWNGKIGEPVGRWHLVIRRTPKANGKGWAYKYSLSNAPQGTETSRLAYQQAQRFWVEQALKDSKDSLGMDEYQARKWTAWHHHMALTMLAGLFVLKTRLEHRKEIPLLSIRDVRDILCYFLPCKIQTFEDVMRMISSRHALRYDCYIRKRQKNRGKEDASIFLSSG